MLARSRLPEKQKAIWWPPTLLILLH